MSMGIRASAARMPFCRLSHIMSNPTNGHETRIAPHFVLPQSYKNSEFTGPLPRFFLIFVRLPRSSIHFCAKHRWISDF